MKQLITYAGILIIIIGVMLLVMTSVAQLDTHNWLLASGLLLVVAKLVAC
jgi:uncharacterized membrane protein HdeD (DUF308 family)